MRSWGLLIGLALLILLVGWGCTHREDKSPVVARVGGSVLTVEDVDEQIPPDYTGVVTPEQKEEFVRRWIDTELLYREALRRGIHRDAKVKRIIEGMRKELLAAELVERELKDKVKVTQEEVEEYYRTHREEFTRDQPEVRARYLLMENRRKAWRVWKKLVTGEDFEKLLREEAIEGGDLGYFGMDDVPQEVARAAFSLGKGQISKPVKGELGYYIIQVLDRQETGTVRPLEMVREEIVDRLMATKRRDYLEGMIKRLREKEEVEVHLEALSLSPTAPDILK